VGGCRSFAYAISDCLEIVRRVTAPVPRAVAGLPELTTREATQEFIGDVRSWSVTVSKSLHSGAAYVEE
jgi:hypothetical protein